MKKYLLLLALTIATLVACSDKDDPEKEPETPPVENPDEPEEEDKIDFKLLESVVTTVKSTESTLTFEYDKKGRIVKIFRKTKKYDEVTERESSYEYGDKKITYNTVNGMTEAPQKFEYTLNDKGLIISSLETTDPKATPVVYEYDAKDQLIKAGETSYTWEDGDIVKLIDEEGSLEITYTETEYKGHSAAGLDFQGAAPLSILRDQGYMGKNVKHLPLSDQEDFTYEYTLDADGYVTEMKINYEYASSGPVSTTTLKYKAPETDK